MAGYVVGYSYDFACAVVNVCGGHTEVWMADLSEITNFIVIDDHLATAGQPTADQIVDIGKAEYDVVINLATSGSENALSDEGECVARQGMQYVHIPVVWNDPQKTDFELFAEVLKAHGDSKVFAHCVVNMRVSAFTFLYRIVYGNVDPAKAKATMQRIWDPHGVWEQLVEEILSAHGVDYFDID